LQRNGKPSRQEGLALQASRRKALLFSPFRHLLTFRQVSHDKRLTLACLKTCGSHASTQVSLRKRNRQGEDASLPDKLVADAMTPGFMRLPRQIVYAAPRVVVRAMSMSILVGPASTWRPPVSRPVVSQSRPYPKRSEEFLVRETRSNEVARHSAVEAITTWTGIN
jgi:hypothetical protein